MQLIRMLKCMFALLLSLLILTSQTSQGAGQVYAVDAQPIEVRLVPDKPTIMLETNSYELKFRACGALSRFNDEAAFQALKKEMDIKGENEGNTTTKEVARQLAENIRLAAATALAKSPHPGAVPFLLSKRNDTYEGIRIIVLHVLGKMKPEKAIPILQEMMHDQSKIVRDEAKRYLNLLSPKE